MFDLETINPKSKVEKQEEDKIDEYNEDLQINRGRVILFYYLFISYLECTTDY